MKHGPDIAYIAALIGDHARANILTALMSGKALTATELANEAGVTAQTASSHLSRLSDGGLVAVRKSGRHKYYSLAEDEVADVLEALMGLAAQKGHLRTRTGPKDAELRKARVCYNHLAGDMGVRMYQAMCRRGFVAQKGDSLVLTDKGRDFLAALGIKTEAMPKSRAPLCRACLDWSERQSHLAGQVGRAMLTYFIEQGWAQRVQDTRIVRFNAQGEAAFIDLFE